MISSSWIPVAANHITNDEENMSLYSPSFFLLQKNIFELTATGCPPAVGWVDGSCGWLPSPPISEVFQEDMMRFMKEDGADAAGGIDVAWWLVFFGINRLDSCWRMIKDGNFSVPTVLETHLLLWPNVGKIRLP